MFFTVVVFLVVANRAAIVRLFQVHGKRPGTGRRENHLVCQHGTRQPRLQLGGSPIIEQEPGRRRARLAPDAAHFQKKKKR